MAYCRFGRSDAYIYHNDKHGFVCCACRLTPEIDGIHQDYKTHSAEDMCKHVDNHIKLGHNLPHRIKEAIMAGDERIQ